MNPLAPRTGINLPLVLFKGAVWLTSNYQLIVGLYAVKGVYQNVQSFVVSDESEEQKILLDWLQTEHLFGFFP